VKFTDLAQVLSGIGGNPSRVVFSGFVLFRDQFLGMYRHHVAASTKQHGPMGRARYRRLKRKQKISKDIQETILSGLAKALLTSTSLHVEINEIKRFPGSNQMICKFTPEIVF